jgi:hypothetical protein
MNDELHDMKSPRNSLNFSSKIYGAPFERMLRILVANALLQESIYIGSHNRAENLN